MKKKFTLAALAGVPLIMVLGNSMLIPVLPKMKSTLDITQFQVSLVITLFSVPAGLAIPFAGFLSDRISRKKIIVPALILYGLGGVVALLGIWLMEKPYYVIMAGRVLQGIGAAGTAPIAMALSSDIFTSSDRSKSLGLLEASNGLGKVISPIFGSLIGMLAWYATFFVFPVLCVPTAIAVWFLVQDPMTNKKPKSVKNYLSALKKIFQGKGVHLASAFFGGSIALFVLFGTLFFLSDHLEQKYNLFGVRKGLVLAIPVLASSSTSFITGMITGKKSNKYKFFVVGGLILIGIANSVIPFFIENIYIFIAALVVGGVGSGLVLTCLNTIITGSVSMEERGMITSLYGAVRFFGVAIGPPVFGILMEISNLATFLTPAGLAFLASVGCMLFVKQKFIQSQNQSTSKEQEQDTMGKKIFDTLTMKNTIGRLVLRPKTAQLKKLKDKEEIIKAEFAGSQKEEKTSEEFAGQEKE
ncbi:MAG: MFS transporter [Clostridia bacterium]|jgi:ACDE family multidrug resistance protein|nr:MFS transporter [Clostridia bacterium]